MISFNDIPRCALDRINTDVDDVVVLFKVVLLPGGGRTQPKQNKRLNTKTSKIVFPNLELLDQAAALQVIGGLPRANIRPLPQKKVINRPPEHFAPENAFDFKLRCTLKPQKTA